MSQRQYFETTRVAIYFTSQVQHKAILKFFGREWRQAWTMPGCCTIYRYKTVCGYKATYSCHPVPQVYHWNGYLVISFQEFQLITGESRLNLAVLGII